MRAKNIHVGYCRSSSNLDYTAHVKTQRELANYRAAREQGVQPAGTHQGQIDFALKQSEATGKPFNAADPL